MQFINHYSAPILAALLLVGGLTLVLRRGGKMRPWLVLGGAMVVLGAAWWVFRPVATSVTPAAGLPLLLEVQSPYCLGCVAMKPVVDRLEYELRGTLLVRRVDIQSAEGRKLASQYGIEMTPTFVFFDTAGNEQWRSAGHLDAARVRTSLQSHWGKALATAHRAVRRPPARWDSCVPASVLELRNLAVSCPSGKLALENRTVQPPIRPKRRTCGTSARALRRTGSRWCSAARKLAERRSSG